MGEAPALDTERFEGCEPVDWIEGSTGSSRWREIGTVVGGYLQRIKSRMLARLQMRV